MNELVDLSLRLVVLAERSESKNEGVDLLSILGEKVVAQYGEQEREGHVRLLPDVLPADGLFGNEGRFIQIQAGDLDPAERILASLTRIFVSFASELGRYLPRTSRLVHSGCLLSLCRGDWQMKVDCFNLLRLWGEERLEMSIMQVLLQMNIVMQVFEAVLLPSAQTVPEDSDSVELVRDAFFTFLSIFCSYSAESLELRGLQATISGLARQFISGQLDSLKREHQVILAKILLLLENKPDQLQRNWRPEILLEKCIRLGLTEQVEQLVWEEVDATLLKELSRPGKRRAEGDPTDVILNLTESKLWDTCCSSYKKLIVETKERSEYLSAFLTVSINLGRRIVLKSPGSAFVVFDSATLSFLASVLEGLVTSRDNQHWLLSVVRDLTLLLYDSQVAGESSEEISLLLVGIASREGVYLLVHNPLFPLSF
jgi:hypothetical protein